MFRDEAAAIGCVFSSMRGNCAWCFQDGRSGGAVTNMLHVVPVTRVGKGTRTGIRQRQYVEDDTKEYSKQVHLRNL